MRIGFDANPMVGDKGGVGWHSYNLLRTMLAQQEGIEFVAYARPGAEQPDSVKEWQGVERLQWINSSKWGMGKRGSSDQLDLYHGTNFKMQTVGRYGGVVTIHDLWLDRHPEYSKKMLGQWSSSFKTRQTALRARKAITVSEFSARELVELYGLKREHIRVVPNGVSEDFAPRRDDQAMAELRKRIGLTSEHYVLFIGGADPRKNHQIFLEAAEIVRKKLGRRMLVLVGSPIHPFGSYEESARRRSLTEKVLCPGRVSYIDLQLLYSCADLFVFPSLYEGFGMPVLEAMACGVPVLTSNSTALVEVAGDAAVLADPHDARALGEAMIRALEDEPLRAALKIKGFARAKQFSWENAAVKTVALYRELCDQ
ncbi:MAG TPA: glycosyltransferase family 1 protein, partial [Nitrospiraceae bacterium]|nr:glycosyltransferase family 1 protein [Nitrospiraceae bacterium]